MKKIKIHYPFVLLFFLILVALYVVFRYVVLVPVCAFYARMRGVMERLDEFDLWLSLQLRDYWRRL